MLVTARPEVNNQGYILAVSDRQGGVKLGIKAGTNPRFEYSDQNGVPGASSSPRFVMNLSDGKRHQFAFSVRGQSVTLYLDCVFEVTRPLARSSMSIIGLKTVLSIASKYRERDEDNQFQVLLYFR